MPSNTNPDPSDLKIPKLTPEDLEKAEQYSTKLLEKLPLVDPLDLADTIATKTEEHLAFLMNREEKTPEKLHHIASQLGWWNVLLITKLRAVALDDLVRQQKIIIPGSEAS